MQNSGVFCWGLPEKLGAYGAGNPLKVLCQLNQLLEYS